jgi:hypothetical protein
MAQAPFTSEIVGSILAIDSCVDSCEKCLSTLCRKSWVFSGRSGFLPQGKLTENITIVVKIIVGALQVILLTFSRGKSILFSNCRLDVQHNNSGC